MQVLKENQRRAVVAEFYTKHKHLKKSFTVNHFYAMGVPKRTIYDICQRVDSGKTITRKSGSGRRAKKMPKKKRMCLIEDAHGKLGVSLRKLGRKYKIDKKYVSDILKKENVILKARKIAPKYTEKQKNEQKKKLRQLSENEFAPSNGLEVIIDDESFFTLDGSDTANNRYYYCKAGRNVDEEVYFKRQKKICNKIIGLDSDFCKRTFMCLHLPIWKFCKCTNIRKILHKVSLRKIYKRKTFRWSIYILA